MLVNILVLAALVAAPVSAPSQSQARDEEMRWKLPLQQKVEVIQSDISARHLVEGTYVPAVPVLPQGGPVNHTTTGTTGDMHTSSWTGCYLLGQAFRYGWAKEHGTPADVDRAMTLAEEALHGLDVLSHVTGKPGLLARQIFYGHGPGSEERAGVSARNEWHQGVGKYIDLRYREHPSHHNYHHVLRGLAIWYYFLTNNNPNPTPREQAQIAKVRSIYIEMTDYAYKAHDMTLYTVDGRYSATLIWGTPPGRFSTQGIMATNCLRFAYWITGDPWFKTKYDQFVEEFGYRQWAKAPPEQWQQVRAASQDDTEHLMASVWLVSQVEQDPELKEFYRKASTWLFDSKQKMKRSPFNYFYANTVQDAQGADLPGALETLHLYPSITLRLPLMNSIRTDLDTARNEGGLLPFNDQPLDNAYDWKTDPTQLDGYLAREITALAVSDEDPMVWFLSDINGTLYQSLDGGRSFTVFESRLNAAIRDITFAGNKSRIALLATSRGIFATWTGGWNSNWRLTLEGDARRVIRDAKNPNVVWAVMGDGVYRSVDLGMEQVGKAWENVTGPMPVQDDVAYGVMTGADPVIYAGVGARIGRRRVPVQDDVAYGLTTGADPVVYAGVGARIVRRRTGDSAWTLSPVEVPQYSAVTTFRQIVVSPADPRVAILLLTSNDGERTRSTVLRTTDGAETIAGILGGGSMSAGAAGRGAAGQGTATRGARGQGGASSRGATGQSAASPGAQRAMTYSEAFRQARPELTMLMLDAKDPQTVYAASPRGAYRSRDGGVTWTQCNTGLRIPYAYRVFAPEQMPGKIFVSTPAGLHVSEDGGDSWSVPFLRLVAGGMEISELGGLAYLTGYWPGRYFGYVTDAQASAAPTEW